MLINQRVIYGDDGTLIDLTKELNNAFSGEKALSVIAAEDYLYIGGDLPFNHRYIVVDSTNKNSLTSSLGVEIYDGSNWNAAVDVIDYTASSGGASLNQSGWIRWTLDRNKAWGQESTTEDITALSDLKVYDFYWLRLKWDSDLTPNTTLKYVGHKFADDEALYAEYPDLNNSDLLAAWETGKSDWEEQHLSAAEYVIQELRKNKLIWTRNQVLDWETYSIAGVHKCAEIIYNGFGDDFIENKRAAKANFKEAMVGPFNVDRDEDGRVDEREKEDLKGIVRR
jgi:hypothetical protein